MRPPRRPLSLSAYIAGFLALGLVLLVSLAGWTLWQLAGIEEELGTLENQAAAAELHDGLRRARERSRAEALAVAGWDETYQQLSDPTYYSYWHGYRLQGSEHLGTHALNAHLYDAKGQALAGDVSAPLAAEIDTPGQWATLDEGRAVLVTVVAVASRGADDAPRGWVAVVHDLQGLLLEVADFRALDQGTLETRLAPDRRYPVGEIESLWTYAIGENPQAEEFRALFERSALTFGIAMVVLGAGFYLLNFVLLVKPLRRLTRAIDRIRGSQEARLELEPLPVLELDAIRQSVREDRQRLREAREVMERQNRSLWEKAHHDHLTGVFNRRAFDEDLSNCAVRDPVPAEVVLAVFDCSHFKTLNDTYGIAVGDDILRVIAQCLAQELRAGDRLYRTGGDEFAALLCDCGPETARALVQAAVRRVHEYHFESLGVTDPVRLTVGIAQDAVDGVLDLPRRADIALVRAKHPSCSPVQVHDASVALGGEAVVSSRVASCVTHALRGEGLEMHYQPVVRVRDGTVAYYESLARIVYAEGDRLTPGQFLPFVEFHRLEREFDLAVLAAIRRDLEGGVIPVGTGVSINLSGYSVIEQDVIERLRELQPCCETHRLVVEITETALIRQFDIARRNLDQLRSDGFYIALDDFGSGYSSIRYLSDMPVDIVKFDRSMMLQIVESGRAGQMIESIARMIVDAGYKIVGEGIETPALMERARESGFGYLQGYHLGRPARPPAAAPLRVPGTRTLSAVSRGSRR